MTAFKKTFQAFVIGGLLFLLPLLVIIILIKKALQIIRPLVAKLVDLLDIHSIFGAATISILGILVLVLICFLSGALIHMGFLKKWNSSFEETLYLLFPSLQRLRLMVLDEDNDQGTLHWKSILLKEDNAFSIAFITATDDNGMLSIFIPDAPDMAAGEVRFIREQNCEYHQIPRKQAIRLLQHFGKGIKSSGIL